MLVSSSYRVHWRIIEMRSNSGSSDPATGFARILQSTKFLTCFLSLKPFDCLHFNILRPHRASDRLGLHHLPTPMLPQLFIRLQPAVCSLSSHDGASKPPLHRSPPNTPLPTLCSQMPPLTCQAQASIASPSTACFASVTCTLTTSRNQTDHS